MEQMQISKIKAGMGLKEDLIKHGSHVKSGEICGNEIYKFLNFQFKRDIYGTPALVDISFTHHSKNDDMLPEELSISMTQEEGKRGDKDYDYCNLIVILSKEEKEKLRELLK